MVKLYLMRHGIAVDRNTAEVSRDNERPLTAEGRRRTRQAAQGMRQLQIRFDRIWTSPFTRACETAAIVAKTLKKTGRFEVHENLIPGIPERKLAAGLAPLVRKCDSVLLVGHEPQLGRCLSLLTTGRPGLEVELKKAALVSLSLYRLGKQPRAVLNWVLAPSHLRALAK